MNIFISWSGERSKNIAIALREWLPNVIQAIQPWMSDSDIDKGARWSSDIASKLEESVMGIICLTPENLEAPWILFEAGAISRTVGKTFVCPFLFQVEQSDISGPLVQFQFTKAIEDETKKLLLTINKALEGNGLPEQNLNNAFQKWWPDLEIKLQNIPDIQVKRKERSSKEILGEILDLVREQSREGALCGIEIKTLPRIDYIILRIIQNRSGHETKNVSKEKIIDDALLKGIFENETEDILRKLKREGHIIEPKSNFFKSIFDFRNIK